MKSRIRLSVTSFAAIFLMFLFSASPGFAANRNEIRVVPIVEGSASSRPFYVSNRDPLLPSGLIKLPIGSITPKGWLRHQLGLEANGMTGRLPEISKWCKFEG